MEHPEDFSIVDPEDWGIRLQEEERRRIARDLHDGPIQVLINLSMRMQIIQRMIKTDVALAEEELNRIQQRLIGSINEIRQLIYDLQPVAIDEVGLYAAIQALVIRAEKEWGLTFTLELPTTINTEIGLTPAKTIAVYRLVQEAFNNIHKHAAARHVNLTLDLAPNLLTVSIVDDGVGFDPSANTAGHFGLAGMLDRVQYLGGLGTITSTPGAGTTLHFTLPRGGHVPKP